MRFVNVNSHHVGQIATELSVLYASNHHVCERRHEECVLNHEQEELSPAKSHRVGRLSIVIW